ncbi:hypothetical protein ACFL36_04800 [Thermodesulfobacteriota bacterium]
MQTAVKGIDGQIPSKLFDIALYALYNIGYNLKNLNDQGLHIVGVSNDRKMTLGIQRIGSFFVLAMRGQGG